MKLTREQKWAYVKAWLWCTLHWRYRPTITTRAVDACEEACKEGVFGLPNAKCRDGCIKATRVVVAITATDKEHRVARVFWPRF